MAMSIIPASSLAMTGWSRSRGNRCVEVADCVKCPGSYNIIHKFNPDRDLDEKSRLGGSLS